ncbi:MAG: DEAD/DEAH box helicase, partial [Desulfovibrionaceae bacterium]|nr:DEAD/DEAH box helicase [Desulfovibrionaceae bacterium]
PGRGFKELLNAARLESHADIPDLKATLRPYQATGVEWLSFLGRIGLGCCLADDMGLGKTIQILALLLKEPNERANLLIAPASLLRNWQAEAAKFAPSLKLLMLHGLSKSELAKLETQGDKAFDTYDLVLSSYAGSVKLPWLTKYPWKRVIADEAQAIKNAQTKQSRAVRSFQTGAHIALTGTPIENSLSDLWALFDFLNPGLLGSAKSFAQLTKHLAEQETRFAPLKRLTSPYILRRMKTDKSVIDSLPDKTEIALYCHLTKNQAKVYVKVTEKLKETLNSFDKSPESVKKRRMVVLQSLMLLKQVCNHPSQATGDGDFNPQDSGKFKAVGDICETIAARQEKVLIFTQFREIINPLYEFLTPIFGQKGLIMHGGIPVKARQDLVDEFQSLDGPPFLILTLKVGGTGLTLTEANHVIHFDRWWNPAVEDQATDRAFRIGQKKNVLVHKCITRGTLEEKIDETIMEKRDLAAEILGERSEINISALSNDEIYNLVRLDASQIGE